jgi:hypothetical protein
MKLMPLCYLTGYKKKLGIFFPVSCHDFVFFLIISELTDLPRLTIPFDLWTSCWLTISCFTHAHRDSDLNDMGFSGTISGGNMKDASCFGIVDWFALNGRLKLTFTRNLLLSMSAGDGLLFDASLMHGSLNPAMTDSDFFRFLFAFYSSRT